MFMFMFVFAFVRAFECSVPDSRLRSVTGRLGRANRFSAVRTRTL